MRERLSGLGGDDSVLSPAQHGEPKREQQQRAACCAHAPLPRGLSRRLCVARRDRQCTSGASTECQFEMLAAGVRAAVLQCQWQWCQQWHGAPPTSSYSHRGRALGPWGLTDVGARARATTSRRHLAVPRTATAAALARGAADAGGKYIYFQEYSTRPRVTDVCHES